MSFQSRLTSKGQVTVPVEVRRKLGLKQGDKIEFREHAGETVISRAARSQDPFGKYAGILARRLKRPFNSAKWLSDLRSED